MTETWGDHLAETTESLPFAHFRELVLDLWGLRGFEVAHRYDDEGAEFVAVRGAEDAEKEVVAVVEEATVEDVRGVAEAAGGFRDALPVVVSKRCPLEPSEKARDLGVKTVDTARIAALVDRGELYWSFYRWVALAESEEPKVLNVGKAPLRYDERGDGAVVVGRSTAARLGVSEGNVVRVGGEASGVVEKGGLLETDRDYVAVDAGYRGIAGEEGDDVTVEVVEADEARRVYVLAEPEVNDETAADVWKGYAPYTGMELSQPRDEGEVRTMALEVLPHDYCYVGDETDVVVEGYAGARRVFDG